MSNKAKSYLGVETAGDETRLVLLEESEGGLKIASTQILKAGEDLAKVVRGFAKRPSAVTSAVSLAGAAIRTLDLPPTTDENLERVVALEAEGALPITAEEMALAHHPLGMTEQSRLEVLVAAARQDTVKETLAKVGFASWMPASVTLSSLALLNALQQIAPTREPVCAVLRIEESSSELLVLNRTRIVVTQTIPIGCGAEAPVSHPAPVPVGASGASEGSAASIMPVAYPWVVSLSQQVRYALQALSYERGLQVERLYVCGKGAAQADADWQLAERLEVPTTPLSPTDSAQRDAARFAVAYGCAVQAAGHGVLSMNLIPARVTVAREFEQRRQSQLSWAALAAAALVAGGLVFASAMYAKEQELSRWKAQLARVETITKEPIHIVMTPTELRKTTDAVKDVLQSRVSAAKTLSALSKDLPANTWVAEVTYNADAGTLVRGYSLDRSAPERAQISLLRQGLFDEVTLDYLTEEQVNKVPAWAFQFTCKLHPKELGARKGGLKR